MSVEAAKAALAVEEALAAHIAAKEAYRETPSAKNRTAKEKAAAAYVAALNTNREVN